MSRGVILTDAERLRSSLASDAERVELAMYDFAARRGAMIVDVADVVGSQGRELFTYPSAATSAVARAIHGQIAAYQPRYVVIVGDERVVPTNGVDVGGGEFTTDYFYGSHTDDGLPDAPVTRVLGSHASMTRQLSESPGAYDGGDTSRRALFLCSEDTRVHLETRAFLQTLQEIGYAPTFTMEPAAEELPHYDAVIHFGHGSDTALSGRWQTYVTADEIPALPRGPIAFVDGCATTPVGSPLVRAFLNQGGTAYIGSSCDVYGMVPARHACELVLYFLKRILRRLAAQVREPIGESLRRARLDYIRAHPRLRDRLREACCTGRCSTPADATDTETVLQWQQYGAPFATLSGSAVEPVFQSHRMLDSPVRLGAGDTLALRAPGTPDGRVPVLSLEGVWLDKITEGVRLVVRQDGVLLHEVCSGDPTIYQQVADTCVGGHSQGEDYRAYALLPLFGVARETEVTVTLAGAGPVTILPGTTVDTWPEDSGDRYINCLDWLPMPDVTPEDARAPVVSGPQMDRARRSEPVRVTGAPSQCREGDCLLLDLAELYTRPHGSLRVGGGDNASFGTWFATKRVEHKGVPFRVATDGNDVLVSPNNTTNLWALRDLSAKASRIHMLVFGYNLPASPLSLRVLLEGGVSQVCEFGVYEWSGTQFDEGGRPLIGDLAFDFDSTAGFPSAAITHAVVDVPSAPQIVHEIACDGGSFGLVAVSIEIDRTARG